MENDLVILVVSCDGYSDLWPVFFDLKRKFWTDCKLKTAIGSNNLICMESGVETICIGEDLSWADNLKKMLERISSKYVLLLLEDFFIDKKIDNDLLDRLFEYVKENNIDCLRLEPSPPPVRIVDKQLKIGILTPGAPYYVSTQPAIWKRQALMELCKPGYSAWDFEIKNSRDSVYFQYMFMGVFKNAFYHKNGVERGKYYESTIDLLFREHIMVDIDKRGIIKEKRYVHELRRRIVRVKMWLKSWKVELCKK